MAILRSSNIEPSTGTTLSLGASGDSIAVGSDSIKANTWQDIGGNNLWTSNGSGTLSNINSSLSGGGYTKISENAFSGNSTCDFITGIDSTYDEYLFLFINMRPSTDGAELQMQISTDAGSTWGQVGTTSYFKSLVDESGSNGQLGIDASFSIDNSNAAKNIGHNFDNGASSSGSGILHLFTPSNTTFIKHFTSTIQQVYSQSPNGSTTRFSAGAWEVTAAITGVQFKFDSGQINGYIAMYGVS